MEPFGGAENKPHLLVLDRLTLRALKQRTTNATKRATNKLQEFWQNNLRYFAVLDGISIWNRIHDHGTSHMSIIDRERNAVSMTITVNSYFGSHILSPSTGILLNNKMGDFSIPMNVSAGLPPPAPSNFIKPGKRPLSSMAPTIVLENEQLKAVVGASGGGMIIAGTVEVLLNHFARAMDPFSSVMAPRVYHQLIPNVVYYENWTTVSGDHFEVPADIRLALQKKGHVLQSIPGGTICQFVVQDVSTSKENVGAGKLVAVSDPRKGGLPSGF